MPKYDVNPVQVLRRTFDGIWKLDERALKDALMCAWDEPTAIISICGDKRKGKSFLLNLLMHNLAQTRVDKLVSQLTGETLSSTFKWRGGPTRDTEGIWITNKPIAITTTDGKVQVYIIDTQGMFDNATTKHECTQIFTLATLMSSIMVFNVLRQLQSNDIEQLSFWTRSARWISNDESKPVLQKLIFLIRDFPHEKLGFGEQGGNKYLEQQIEECEDNEETFANVAELQKIFQSVSAFAMPSPGETVTKRGHNEKPLKLKDINPKFRHYTSQLFQKLKKGVTPLQLSEGPMSGSSLYSFVVKCSEQILTGQMPKAKDISDLVADHWLEDLVTNLVKEFRKRMEEKMGKCRNDLVKLREEWKLEKSNVLESFDKANKFGREAVIQDARRFLMSAVEELFETISSHCEKTTKMKETERGLVEYISQLQDRYRQLTEKHKTEAQMGDQENESAACDLSTLEVKINEHIMANDEAAEKASSREETDRGRDAIIPSTENQSSDKQPKQCIEPTANPSTSETTTNASKLESSVTEQNDASSSEGKERERCFEIGLNEEEKTPKKNKVQNDNGGKTANSAITKKGPGPAFEYSTDSKIPKSNDSFEREVETMETKL